MSKRKILLSGSIAYDHLLKFDGKFQDNLTFERISNCFVTKEKHVEIGGCGVNVAYGLSKLGVDFDLYGVVGAIDADLLLSYLTGIGIDIEHIHPVINDLTATAYVTSDSYDQQISCFYPGPSLSEGADLNLNFDAKTDYSIAMVSPNNVILMKETLDFARNSGIPIFFDPGQMICDFDKDVLMRAIKDVSLIFVNQSEMALLMRVLDIDDISHFGSRFAPAIVTHGINPTWYIFGNERLEVPVSPLFNGDPTGCGDAFRAGFIHSYTEAINVKLDDFQVMKGYIEAAHCLAGKCYMKTGAQGYTI